MNLVGFVAGRGSDTFYQLFHLLSKNIEARNAVLIVGDLRGLKTINVTKDNKVKILYQHASFNPFQELLTSSSRFDEKIASLEKKYGDPNLWPIIASERILDNLNWKQKYLYLAAYLRYFEKIFAKYRPNIYISGDIDCLPAYAAHQVFHYQKIPCFYYYSSRLKNRFVILNNPKDQIYGLDKIFHKLKVEKSADVATGYKKQYTVQKVKPAYFYVYNLKKLLNPFRHLKVIFEYYSLQDYYFDYWLKDRIKSFFSVRWQTIANKFYLRKRYATLSEEKFFFYPLHLEPEITLAIFGFHWRNQLQTIQLISDSLPDNYYLYIKEHPSMPLGKRHNSFYRQISKLPNTRILPPNMNTYEILPKSEGVFTIAGTVGWEALFFNKPVFVFGTPFYSVFKDAVFKIKKPEDIFNKISQVREKPVTWANLDAFITAVHMRSYEGVWLPANPLTKTKQNLQKLVQGFFNEWEFRQKN